MSTKTRNNRIAMAAIAASTFLSASAFALPEFAADNFGRCMGCHGTPSGEQDFSHPSGWGGIIDGSVSSGYFQVTPQGTQTDLGQQLDGQTVGALDTYVVAPGETISLSIDILDGQSNHAITFFGLQNGGQQNSQDNKLSYQYAGDNYWTAQATFSTPSFNYFYSEIGKDFDAESRTIPITINPDTPEDTYLLTFGMSRLRGITATYEEHSIYVKVTSGGEAQPSRLINISTRGFVKEGKAALIGGFVIIGDEPLKVLIQGVGPELNGQGDLTIDDVLADPLMILVNPDGSTVTNDDWGDDPAIAQAQLDAGSNQLASGSKSSAILATLDPGIYTVVVGRVGEIEGIALVEAYEVPSD